MKTINVSDSYYDSHFDEIMLLKIQDDQELTHDELSILFKNYEIDCYDEERDKKRVNIINLQNQTFAINLDCECGKYEQPIRVKRIWVSEKTTIIN